MNGKKFYSTGALFAHFIPTAAVDEEKHGLLVFIPRDTPGLSVIDDWDGFGERTTASGSVLLTMFEWKRLDYSSLSAYDGRR